MRRAVAALILLSITVSDSTGEESEEFPAQLSQSEFPRWLKEHVQGLEWKQRKFQPRLTRGVLEGSLKLGQIFLVNNQKPDGNFNYQYDFLKKKLSTSDNQIRQAGALWGLSLILRNEPNAELLQAVKKGLTFFLSRTTKGDHSGRLIISYPGAKECSTGTVALVSLSIIEVLRANRSGHIKLDPGFRTEIQKTLWGFIQHLVSMQMSNLHFSKSMRLDTKEKSAGFSAYFDGEVILCLVRAARYVGFSFLVSTLDKTIPVLAKHYTVDKWRHVHDSNETKGFFQWSCLAFWEYQRARWKHSDLCRDYVLAMAWWMFHTHRTLSRKRNTAYVFEGIIPAYLIAEKRKDARAMNELDYTIDRGLYKLTSWQVGGPLQSKNTFLSRNITTDELAVGGIMNHKEEAPLRIDVTQHQMHAVILALNYVHRK
ncbi:MAG: hypothetical protein QGG53_27665 [Planctomycetota bacterium]|nr:hypothetical protein [Planctomycetota bacterium]